MRVITQFASLRIPPATLKNLYVVRGTVSLGLRNSAELRCDFCTLAPILPHTCRMSVIGANFAIGPGCFWGLLEAWVHLTNGRIFWEMSPWPLAPAPVRTPCPTFRARRFIWTFSPKRWILLRFHITVVTHLRGLRDLIGRSKHGGGIRNRCAGEFVILNGSAEI